MALLLHVQPLYVTQAVSADPVRAGSVLCLSPLSVLMPLFVQFHETFWWTGTENNAHVLMEYKELLRDARHQYSK